MKSHVTYKTFALCGACNIPKLKITMRGQLDGQLTGRLNVFSYELYSSAGLSIIVYKDRKREVLTLLGQYGFVKDAHHLMFYFTFYSKACSNGNTLPMFSQGWCSVV